MEREIDIAGSLQAHGKYEMSAGCRRVMYVGTVKLMNRYDNLTGHASLRKHCRYHPLSQTVEVELLDSKEV